MAEPAQKQHPIPPSDKRADRERIAATPAANDPNFNHYTGSKPNDRRGVKNVQRIARTHTDHYNKKTVLGQFETKQSVPARSGRKKQKRRRKHRDEQQQRKTARDVQSLKAAATGPIQNKVFLPERTMLRAARHFGFGAWIRISIAGTVYMWQFLFSIFAMFGYTGEGLVRYFQEETTVGKALSWLVDLQKWFPGDVVGNLFTALNLIIVGGMFIIFICVYWLMKYRPFASMGMVFFTSVCLALSILPFVNILPYIIVWVTVMEIRGVYIRRRPKT